MTGYSSEHHRIRAALLPYWIGRPCVRCGLVMGDPSDMHLDHTDDRAGYIGFAHARCNTKAGAALGHQRKRERKERIREMASDIVFGIEISEDRAHTSVCAAGRIDDTDIVLMEVAAYLDRGDEVEAVPSPVSRSAGRAARRWWTSRPSLRGSTRRG